MEDREESATFHWITHSHNHRERTNDWYWGLGTAALIGAAVSWYFGDTLFAVILIMGPLCIGILTVRGPREHTIRVDDRGVSVDGTLFPFTQLRSFSLDERSREPHLILSTKNILNPQLSLRIGPDVDAMSLQEHLEAYLPEEVLHPTIGEHLAELLGL